MDNTSPTNSGASNAKDFQPPTGNPQTAPGQVFPEQNTVQEGGMTKLLENSNVKIHVPVNPAPAPPAVAEAKSGSGLFLLLALIIAVALLSFHLWRKRTVFFANKAPVEPPAEMTVPVLIAQAVPQKAKTTDPKKKAAKKAAKKKKRTRK